MKRFLCAALLCALLAVPSAQALDQAVTRYTTDYFGTVSMLCLYGREDAEDIWREVKELLRTIDESVSVSRPDSDIARLNALPAGGAVTVSACTADIWRCAQEAYRLTGGLYDPTVYPLVDLWGFSPRFYHNDFQPSMPYDRPLENGHPALPREEDVLSLLALVDMEGIALSREGENWVLQKNTPDICLNGTVIHAQADLGGIAKGYACDRVAELLREKGVDAGYFICGGSSMVFLSRPDGAAFAVAAGKPRPGQNGGGDYASFSVGQAALSTSSDISRGYCGEDGVLYCHIIDPRTGYPLNHPAGGVPCGAASVTLVGESAALGDALTTALCLMGPREALAFLAGREERMVMAVYRAGEEHLEVVTNLAAEELAILDAGYILASERDAEGRWRYTGAFVPEEARQQ